MQSIQVTASQLLASFLGSENEKIGHGIIKGDFSGELKKFIAAPANDARVPGDPWRLSAAKPESANAPDPGLKASSDGTQGAPETKTSQSSTVGELKNAADSRTKIDAIKSKAKKEASLFVTNPAIADTILADLQYPAETRKACKGVQNKEGSVSIKDLKSLLDTQPTIGPANLAQVPAEHVRTLVESIIAREGGTKQERLASAGTLQSSVRIKTEGFYTPGQFRGLIEKVLQQADTAQKQLTGSGSLSGSAETAKTAAGMKTGQTVSLVASVLPSFISVDSENASTKQTFVPAVKSTPSEVQSVSAQDVCEHSIEAVSDNLKSDERLIAGKISMKARDRERAALGMEAGTKGVSGRAGSSPDPAAASPSVRHEAVRMPVEGLDPILENFDATIVSAGLQHPEVEADVTPAPGGPHEGSVAQAQNLAPPVKGVEKQADRARLTLSSSRLPQDVAGQSEAARIKTVAAEYPSSEWSFDSDQNRTAGSSQEIQVKAPVPTTYQTEISAQLRETSRGVETDGKEKTPSEILGKTAEKQVPTVESTAGKLSDSVERFGLTAGFSTAAFLESSLLVNRSGSL
ncbi:MAG: hypothetical protein ABSG91_05280 [Syntrophobacteraceae bacterium]|jgi:hypothetical protein